MGNPLNYWKIIAFIGEIKLKSPVVIDAMALLQMTGIFLCVNMDVMGWSRRLSYIREDNFRFVGQYY